MRFLPYVQSIKLPRIICIRILSLFLILIVFLDYAQSGPIRIREVTFYDPQRNIEEILSLPHLRSSLGINERYIFSFDLPNSFFNRLAPIQIIPDDCLIELKINSAIKSLDTFKNERLCDFRNGIIINRSFLGSGEIFKINATIKDIGGDTGLSIYRLTILDNSLKLVFILAALYLLILSSVSDKDNFRRLHYHLSIIALFLLSFWPHNYNLYDWGWWIQYLGNGFAVALVIFLLSLCHNCRFLFVWMNQIRIKILQCPASHFIPCCVLGFFCLAVFLSRWVFDGLPHIADTHVQYMQSKIFVDGLLYENSHAFPTFFDFQNAINNGKYYSGTFPGHPLLIALGQLIGLPWIINPLLGALTVGLVYLVANELAGKAAGYSSVLLMLISPMIIFMSSEYMNHVSCMFFQTLFLYAYLRLCKTSIKKFALLAGFSIGMAFMIRAQAAILFGLPFALHACWLFLRCPKERWRVFCYLVSSFLIPLSFLLYFQLKTNGNAFITGYQMFAPWYKIVVLEFGEWERWLSILDDLNRSINQMRITHVELFAWPTSSLLPLFFLYLFNLQPRYAYLLLFGIFGQYIGFMFMFSDEGSGPFLLNRNVYEASTCVIILIAIGINRVTSYISNNHSNLYFGQIHGVVLFSIIVLTLLAFPFKIMNHYYAYDKDYYDGNWGYNYMIQKTVQKPAIVFISPYEAYRTTYFNQPPQDSSEIIYAIDRGSANQLLMDYYPHRHAYKFHWWNMEKIR